MDGIIGPGSRGERLEDGPNDDDDDDDILVQ